MEILLGVGLGGAALLIVLVVWLSRARSAQVRAETKADVLQKGVERKKNADKVMSEPVADEVAWLLRTRERLRRRRGGS